MKLSAVEWPKTIGRGDAASEVVVVTAVGPVTLAQKSEQIVELVDELLAAGKKTIIFDLAGVTTIDSTGIGRFIASYNKILAAGGEVRMAAATDHLSKIFHVNRLDKIFPFYATLADALKV